MTGAWNKAAANEATGATETVIPGEAGDEGALVRNAVATNMRRLRLARGMSLREMSSQTGLSTSLLSQIEREVANPTVAALTRIAQTLEVTFAELTRSPLTQPEIIRADRSTSDDDSPRARMLFSMMDRRRFDISEGTLPPHREGVFSDHGRGSIEYGYVVTGSVSVTIADDTYQLDTGDAIRFSSGIPHAYSTGEAAATLLTVVAYSDE
jgi:transcriptional regulator with XRE-family HTH domain